MRLAPVQRPGVIARLWQVGTRTEKANAWFGRVWARASVCVWRLAKDYKKPCVCTCMFAHEEERGLGTGLGTRTAGCAAPSRIPDPNPNPNDIAPTLQHTGLPAATAALTQPMASAGSRSGCALTSSFSGLPLLTASLQHSPLVV